MLGCSYARRLSIAALVFTVATVATVAAAGEIYSTMRNVNAVAEAHGFRLNTANDIQPTALPSDLSPAQAFEIVRPLDKPLTIGRLFTSCSCIQLEAHKRTFQPGERAILILRNIKPTPPAGQVYQLFVQVTHPVRTTLRYDTFVQAGGGPRGPGAPGSAPGQGPGEARFEPPPVVAHPPIGRQSGGPAVLLDDELERLGEMDDDEAAEDEEEEEEEVAEAGDETLEIPGLTAPAASVQQTRQPAVPPALDDLPQLAAIPPTGQRMAPGIVEGREMAIPPRTAANAAGDEDDEFSQFLSEMMPAGSAPVQAGLPAPDDADDLRLPGGMVVPDTLGVAQSEFEDMYDQVSTSEDLAANVDAARHAMDGYFRQDQDSGEREPGTADLAVATDLGGDIPDFYAHVPVTPEVASAAPAEGVSDMRGAVVGGWESPEEAEGHGIRVDQLNTVERRDPTVPPSAMSHPVVPAPAIDAREVPPLSPMDLDDVSQRVAASVLQAAPVAPASVPASVQEARPQTAPSVAPQRDPEARKPVQAVSLITVGVRDMQRSIRFYEALGWRRAAPNKYDQTAFFQLQGQILALYPLGDQLREQNMPEASPQPGGITLALHVQDKADVWAIYERFIEAGGKSLRAPAEMASGAVTSYVADPDGNPWEISWVPQFRIDDEGGLWLP